MPATPEGLPAIQTLLGEGINVNITLLFSRQVYEQVAEAYLRAAEERGRQGIHRDVASVASFFVSRIDTAVDAQLNERLHTAPQDQRPRLQRLLGKAAIANARLAYQSFQRIFSGPRWETLHAGGLRPQRLLWASTSTKDPAFSDVMYVEELIGRDTVNTMPPATADAFRDHGRLRNSLAEDPTASARVLQELEQVGISLDGVTRRLLDDGVKSFADSFEKLLAAIRKSLEAAPRDSYTAHLDPTLTAAVAGEISAWQAGNKVKRLWEGDASLWTGGEESRWLGWLQVVQERHAHLGPLQDFAAWVKQQGFCNAVVLGMGGSSLAPEVLARSFGPQAGFPLLTILDSTDPAQVRALEARVDPAHTLFIVSSKSGSTLEPELFRRYFYDRVRAAVGADRAGGHFVAVTDPGSALERAAQKDGYYRVFHGVPGIGGRYSALSNFGLVPAAAMGLDLGRLLDCAEGMAHACAECVPARDNPGLALGAALGVAGNRGRNKLTLVASPGIADFGAWLEQLLAESTGKDGKGIIPVEGEPPGGPDVYGGDRLFAYLRFTPRPNPDQDRAVRRLADAGQPVLWIELADPYELGANSSAGSSPPPWRAASCASIHSTSQTWKPARLPRAG